ncbi:MAG: cation-translocating P-type ATPase [Hyphomicrobiales bacterium]|nr:cation-translocating P-type ATPase [Hyphomicrobiales bacterium]
MTDRCEPNAVLAGLDEAEAARRLALHGPNEIPSPGGRSALGVVAEVLREPMFLMLLAAAGLYLIVGDPIEGAVLSLFAGLSVGLVIVQEIRGERALDALRDLSAPTARVRRGGRDRVLPAREVVPGDLLVLAEGDRIAADAVLRDASGLVVDESLLTGESVPVRKSPEPRAAFCDERPGGDDRPEVWASTLVVGGRGWADVARTGAATSVGAIGLSLAAIDETATGLQAAIAGIVRVFAIFGGLASAALVLLVGLQDGDWIAGLLAGLALAMAMLPEEFPMALAIFVTLGARRLAVERVLTRRPAIIETLGAITVLAVDKTGTLTENRMRLALIGDGADEVDWDDARQPSLQPSLARLLAAARRASRRDGPDPIDAALRRAAPDEADGERVADWGVTPDLLAMTRVWRDPAGRLSAAAKGAPEAIFDLCRLPLEERERRGREAADLAARGLRLLAVAEADDLPAAPADPRDVAFRFLGWVGFADPLRASVPAAVARARAAGVRVVMITGDMPATALAVAAAAGLSTAAGCLTGPEIETMDEATLAGRAAEVSVFARIMPAEKLRVVRALQASGAVVAMTGDGVNDAPALEAAHVGIAVGPRATDVAKEASDIVLLDEDFGAIVSGVRLGRRIFDNLRKVMIYIAAIHVPIAGVALIPVVLGHPPLILPLHVALIEMVIDPICSIAFESEPEEEGVMERPPRPLAEPFVGLGHLAWGLAQGLGVLVACLVVEAFARRDGHAADEVRTLVFIALTAGNLALVQVDAALGSAIVRAFTRVNGVSWAITLLTAGVLAGVILTPGLADLFGFARVAAGPALGAILAGVVAPILFDLAKFVPALRRRPRPV